MRIKEVVPIYLRHLQTLSRSYYTIKGAKAGLRDFTRFLDSERFYDLEDLVPEVMEEYQRDLAFRLTAKGSLRIISFMIPEKR